MKKCLILLLTMILMGVLPIAASAAGIGVNVPPGYVLEVDSYFTQGTSEICPSFIAGLSKGLAVGVMYDTYLKNFTVCGRYQIVKNLSTDLYYTVDGSNAWAVDLRGKYFFNQSLALAGKYSHNYNPMLTNNSLFGQAEYYFNEHWMGNAGLMYTYFDPTMPSSTSIVLGGGCGFGYLEFGVNYIAPINNLSNPTIEVALDYLIKK
jgi:hypothetical protein